MPREVVAGLAVIWAQDLRNATRASLGASFCQPSRLENEVGVSVIFSGAGACGCVAQAVTRRRRKVVRDKRIGFS
jgi:hypothetical protein